MRAAAIAAALIGAAALSAAPAGADSITPVTLAITSTPVARLHAPLRITVDVTADPGILDIATAPLRIRVKLAGECGGTFASTPGVVLLDAELSPQPTTQRPYDATARGRGKPTAYGVQTVCAFLEEEGDNRMFANDTSNQVNVSQPCTSAAHRYDAARKSLARARRHLRHSKRGAKRTRLRRLVAKREHRAASDRRRAASACGPGVRL